MLLYPTAQKTKTISNKIVWLFCKGHSSLKRPGYYTRHWWASELRGQHNGAAAWTGFCSLYSHHLSGTTWPYPQLRLIVVVPSLSVSDSLWSHGLQHARIPCSSLSPGVCSNSCPLSGWCYLTISSSAAPFFCLQSYPASGSFPVSWLFASCSQSIGNIYFMCAW